MQIVGADQMTPLQKAKAFIARAHRQTDNRELAEADRHLRFLDSAYESERQSRQLTEIANAQYAASDKVMRQTIIDAAQATGVSKGSQFLSLPERADRLEARRWLVDEIGQLKFEAEKLACERFCDQLAERFKWRWFTINGCINPTPLLTRFRVWETKRGNLYLHVFHRGDEDRELHDHPWNFWTFILWRGYLEHLPGGKIGRCKPLRLYRRPATYQHRVELLGERKPAITIVWVSNKVRDWGFWQDDGTWIKNTDYHKKKGCGGV